MKKMYTIIVAIIIASTMCIPAFAATRKNIYIPENQAWTSKMSDSRAGNNGDVSATCHSVYPLSGTDNFSKIQCRSVSSEGVLIVQNEYYVLTEGKGAVLMELRNGYHNLSTVYFQFRGNTNKDAYAVVSYSGR